MTASTQRLLRPAIIVAATLVASLAAFAVLAGGRPQSGPPSQADLPVPRPGEPTDSRIARLQRIAVAAPRDASIAAQLGAAYLQKVRETGDPSYYARAQTVLDAALRASPRSPDALAGAATLALARHDFRAGLAAGRRALAAAPASMAAYPAIVDGEIELGRYREAARDLQRFVDGKPGLASYARVSYFRELHGDVAGALEAMALAADSGGDAAENVAYAQTLLGDLRFSAGHVDAAAGNYREALARFPGYHAARAGLAKVDAARGDLALAARRYRAVVARLPLPSYVVALGEVELADGHRAAARRDLGLVAAEQRLLAASGVNTDVDLALYEANHGSPSRAVRLAARARARAPSVRSADALGWALTRAGRPRAGERWARRALALGSRDASFLYHAGMAALAAGDRRAARTWLRGSLAMNPRWSPLYAPRARRALRGLGG